MVPNGYWQTTQMEQCTNFDYALSLWHFSVFCIMMPLAPMLFSTSQRLRRFAKVWSEM